jgi:hypothetical protein
MASKQQIDALAEKIRAELSKKGYFIIPKSDLEILWDEQADSSDEEKDLVVRNFAVQYRLNVYLASNLSVVLFHHSK